MYTRWACRELEYQEVDGDNLLRLKLVGWKDEALDLVVPPKARVQNSDAFEAWRRLQRRHGQRDLAPHPPGPAEPAPLPHPPGPPGGLAGPAVPAGPAPSVEDDVAALGPDEHPEGLDIEQLLEEMLDEVEEEEPNLEEELAAEVIAGDVEAVPLVPELVADLGEVAAAPAAPAAEPAPAPADDVNIDVAGYVRQPPTMVPIGRVTAWGASRSARCYLRSKCTWAKSAAKADQAMMVRWLSQGIKLDLGASAERKAELRQLHQDCRLVIP